MLESSRGFTIIQFIAAMTVAGLLFVGVIVYVAQIGQRDDQRKANLGLIEGVVGRYAENHLGKYPPTKQASVKGSELQIQFDALRLLDQKTGQYYVLNSDFDDCNGGAKTEDHGPGYVSYKSPGDGGPFLLRICLERGEFYLGN